MPDELKGTVVGTADMRGGEVTFKDREGNEVGFEMVPRGMTKEFDTVKAALANAELTITQEKHAVAALEQNTVKMAEKLATADAAYLAEKESSAALRASLDGTRVELADSDEERGRLHGLLDSEKAASAQLQEEIREGDKARLELRNANAGLSDEKQRLCSELENLMQTKAQLEETNTALETSERHLCESRASFTTLHGQMVEFFETEKTGIDAVMQLLEKLAGE